MAKRKTAVADGNPAEETPPVAIPLDQPPVEQPVQTEAPPEPVNGNKPVETFSVPCGGGAYIQASIWPKTIQYEGRDLVVYSVTVRKSYKDGQTGEWKNTHSFRGSELYCVQHVLARASTWIMDARTTTSTDCPF